MDNINIYSILLQFLDSALKFLPELLVLVLKIEKLNLKFNVTLFKNFEFGIFSLKNSDVLSQCFKIR